MNLDITEIIRDRMLTVLFQPIISINQKGIYGLEGLIRGIDKETGELIPPLTLFDAARKTGRKVELDRACREKVLKTYATSQKARPDSLLFLNIDSSILDRVAGSNHLINMVNTFEINPSDIVIEINESRVSNNDTLSRFVKTYRDYGFLIALDDVGTGFSSLERISLVKPDIVKVDIALVRNICDDYYVKEVFRSLVNLATRIGALVIAEGIETESQAIQTLELGVRMIQGYFFATPAPIDKLPGNLNQKINEITRKLQIATSNTLKQEMDRYNKLDVIIDDIIDKVAALTQDSYEETLLKEVHNSSSIECIYILDEFGIQSGDTIFSRYAMGKKENRLFHPAITGTDHSMKNYYYYLINTDIIKYVTEPYISLATGKLCVTVSKGFQNVSNKKSILCIDLKVPGY
jgi:EAL domain-containing protein (putative c-di-GMP-specific phosphodiesterase class I)